MPPRRFPALAVPLVLLAACGGGISAKGGPSTALPPVTTPSAVVTPAAPAADATSAAAPTSAAVTTAAAPTQSVAPSPSAPSGSSVAPSPSPAASTMPAAAQPGLIVDGTGSSLTKPTAPTSKTLLIGNPDPTGCYGLLDSGFSKVACEKATEGATTTAFVIVEIKGTEERTLVWAPEDESASLALRRVRTVEPGEGASGKVGLTRLSSDSFGAPGTGAVVVATPPATYHSTNDARIAQLDVIEGKQVVLHREIAGGGAGGAGGAAQDAAMPGQGAGLYVWSPRADGSYDLGTFTQGMGVRWSLVRTDVVKPSTLPGSEAAL